MQVQNSLQTIVSDILPALGKGSITYNADRNMYLTEGYTSAAGNTYFQVLRLSKNLVVEYNIGQGYALAFLNGISLFAFNGSQKTLIGKKEWGGANWMCFSESRAKEIAIGMLCDYILAQAKILGRPVDDGQVKSFSRLAIEETERKLIA